LLSALSPALAEHLSKRWAKRAVGRESHTRTIIQQFHAGEAHQRCKMLEARDEMLEDRTMRSISRSIWRQISNDVGDVRYLSGGRPSDPSWSEKHDNLVLGVVLLVYRYPARALGLCAIPPPPVGLLLRSGLFHGSWHPACTTHLLPRLLNDRTSPDRP